MDEQRTLPGIVPADELLSRIAQAWQAEAVAWVVRCGLVEQLDGHLDDVGTVTGELACLLHTSSMGAGRVWADAEGLRQLPVLRDAVLAGRLDVARARVVLDLLCPVRTEVGVAVLTLLLAGETPVTKTPAQLRSWIAQQLLATDPEDAAERREDAVRKQTGVRMRPLPDGLAEAVISGPADAVLGLMATLDRALPAADPTGLTTRGQQRLDTLLGLFFAGARQAGVGTPTVELQLELASEANGYRTHVGSMPLAQPEPLEIRCTVEGLAAVVAAYERVARELERIRSVGGAVTGGALVDVTALRTALRDPFLPERDALPAEALPTLRGYGAIDPEQAASIVFGAAGPPGGVQVRRIMVDPLVGACAVDATTVPLAEVEAQAVPQPPPPTDGYRFTAAQRRVLRARDPRCTHPGCRRKATRCDLDHVVPWPLGATTIGNGGPKCRRHHRFKHGDWRVERRHDGTEVWISPLGGVYVNDDRE